MFIRNINNMCLKDKLYEIIWTPINKGVKMISLIKKYKEQIMFAVECAAFLLMLVAVYFFTIFMCALSDKCASYYGMMGGI
jgi:hypothetical protein|tara:strand:+ start:1443 stop:1685 length:243 start_codon:yes stop_codon:yes gene_type:complete